MDRIWHKSYDPDVPFSLEYPETSLPLILEQNAKSFSDVTAIEFFGAKLTYSQFWSHVLRLANGLRHVGVGEGTKAAIMLPNTPQFVIAYYAVLWLGATAILTNPLYVERELVHQWTDSDAEVLFTLDHLYPKVQKVLPRTGIRSTIVTSIKDYLPFPLNCLYPLKARFKKLFTSVPFDGIHLFSFKKMIEENRLDPIPCSAHPDGLALLQYTGGTTGTPKGAMLTHRNIFSNVAQAVAWLPGLVRGKERFLSVLPFFHVFGMTVALNLAIYTGSSMIIMPRFDAGEVMRTIKKKRPTMFPGVPAIYIALMAHPKIHSFDLTSIRICITGAAPMPVEILRKFEEKTGSKILEGYGLSEASPVTHVNPIGGTRKPGSIGIPLPDTDCRIVDAQTGIDEVPTGRVGELIVRGPQVMRGYWKKQEETSQTLRDGWLYTGDLATMDSSGYVFIVDRKKDLVIMGGYNVYPREIEEVLYEHPKVQDAAAIGIPHPKMGEAVKVFVVPKRDADLSQQEVLDWCKEKLAPYKVPKEVELRDSLPKTMVGKVLRRELRESN
ncbi:MAG TPA: long-chain fatty acid--CoA ligase [Syntrophobacteraceae bacterium]|nr:long-chain fatty acid--CoA ligase [Syntrophobacteraceae bacterium]